MYRLTQSQHGSWWIQKRRWGFWWVLDVRTTLDRAIERLREIAEDPATL